MSRPPSLFTSMRRPIHGTSCPKSQLKSTCLTAKFGSFSDHTETGEKGQNVISSSVQHPISLIFATHASLIIPLPMMWILLTKPMQKSVTTVCLHCSFARLKNKHIYRSTGDQCSHNELATLVPSAGYTKCIQATEIIMVTLLTFSESRNIDEKFGSFVAVWANGLWCISELGELTYGQRY